jgi:hypothetical protein
MMQCLARIVVFVASRRHHCRSAAFTATTATGVSNTPRPLLVDVASFPCSATTVMNYCKDEKVYFRNYFI